MPRASPWQKSQYTQLSAAAHACWDNPDAMQHHHLASLHYVGLVTYLELSFAAGCPVPFNDTGLAPGWLVHPPESS